MPRFSQKDFSCLLNMLESVEKIQKYSSRFSNADEFNADTLSFDATMMNFIVIGEMVEKLSAEFTQATEAEIEWSRIRGFRNIIAHNYFGIDAEEVWQIIHGRLVHLKEFLTKILV